MTDVVFSIDDKNGDTTFIVNDITVPFIDENSKVKRASHVEPTNALLRAVFYTLRGIFGEYSKIGNWTRNWACMWRINLSPINGPILPQVYSVRQAAIEAEIQWLNENFL